MGFWKWYDNFKKYLFFETISKFTTQNSIEFFLRDNLRWILRTPFLCVLFYGYLKTCFL